MKLPVVGSNCTDQLTTFCARNFETAASKIQQAGANASWTFFSLCCPGMWWMWPSVCVLVLVLFGCFGVLCDLNCCAVLYLRSYCTALELPAYVPPFIFWCLEVSTTFINQKKTILHKIIFNVVEGFRYF